MPKKQGRPTKYKSTFCEQAYKLCLLGAIDKELADFFDVTEDCITKWKKNYPEFLLSLKEGKVQADANVAESLYKRACGYKHPDVHISNYQGDITITDITKHYPPDTAAAFIWLKNRAGWRDKQEHEHGVTKELSNLLGLIDGSTKGKLPDQEESKNAG